MAEEGDDKASEVLKVGVRIPPFYPQEPALWFAQIEAQFALSNIIADTTRFYYVSGQLEAQYAMEVMDIIKSPPVNNKYEKLKEELIKRLSASQEKKIKQLLDHEELGDRKPSQFLRHLQNLAGPSGSADFVKTIWTNRLPQNIQTVIASQITELPLDVLSTIADKVHEIAPTTPQVSSASTSAGEASTSSDIMAKQISELTRQVALLTSRLCRGERRQTSRGSRSRSNSRNKKFNRRPQPPPNHPHCFYHYNFAEKANKCQKPCSFNSGNSQGGRK